MKKSVRFALAALVLAAASGGAQAGVIANWGNISAPGATFDLSHSFSSTTTFSDDYLFALGNSGGSTGDLDTFNALLNSVSIELSSVKLFKDGSLFGTDTTPTGGFTFAGLTAGNYSLQVNGKATSAPLIGGLFGGASYTVASRSAWRVHHAGTTSPTSVPEPTTFALLSAGIAAIGFMRRRKPVEA